MNATKKDKENDMENKGNESITGIKIVPKCAAYFACINFHLDIVIFLVEYCQTHNIHINLFEVPAKLQLYGIIFPSNQLPNYHTLLHELTMRSVVTLKTKGVSVHAIVDMVQYILTNTSLIYELNIQDIKNEYTILHYAIATKNVELVKYLLEYTDADTIIENTDGDTAYSMGKSFAIKQLFIGSFKKRRDSQLNGNNMIYDASTNSFVVPTTTFVSSSHAGKVAYGMDTHNGTHTHNNTNDDM